MVPYRHADGGRVQGSLVNRRASGCRSRRRPTSLLLASSPAPWGPLCHWAHVPRWPLAQHQPLASQSLATRAPGASPGVGKCRPGRAPRAGRSGPRAHGWGRSCRPGPVLAPLLSPRPRHRRLALSSVLSDGPLPGHPQTCPPGGGKRAWDGSAGGVWPRHPQGCPCHSLCGRREPGAAPGTGCSPNPHGPAGRGGPGRRRLAGQGTVVGGHGCPGEGWGRFGVCVGSHSRAQRQAAVGRGSRTCCCAADTGHSRGPVRGPQAGPSPPLGREKWGKQGQL